MCAAVAPDGKGMLIFFHAQGPPESKRWDTYVDRLLIEPDARLGVNLRVVPLDQ